MKVQMKVKIYLAVTIFNGKATVIKSQRNTSMISTGD